MKCINNNETNK